MKFLGPAAPDTVSYSSFSPCSLALKHIATQTPPTHTYAMTKSNTNRRIYNLFAVKSHASLESRQQTPTDRLFSAICKLAPCTPRIAFPLSTRLKRNTHT